MGATRFSSFEFQLIRLKLFFAGGTAVGTGLNTRIGFAEKIAAKVADITGKAETFKKLNII